MKQLFLILLLLSYVENILRVSVAEYNRHNNRNNQFFEIIALSPEEHLKIIDHY